MAHVYLLSEDDFDDQVYVWLLEAILGVRVDPLTMRLRRGGGVGEVRKKLPLLTSIIRRTGPVDDAYFLVALDNDRAFEHPTHAPTPHGSGERCRTCALTDAIHDAMPDGWPIAGAVAVPVQMLESWLLLLHDAGAFAHESALPSCALRDQALARRLCGPNPPPQLKDLLETARLARGAATRLDLAFECILGMSAADLARRSPSFARFWTEVARWGLG